MVQVFIVVTLHEFHALILDPQVVTVGGNVSAGGVVNAAVIEDRHAVEFVDFLTYPIMRIPIEQRRSFP